MDLPSYRRARNGVRAEVIDDSRHTGRSEQGLDVTSTSSSTSEPLGAVGGSSSVVHHHHYHHHHHHHLPRSSSPRLARHHLPSLVTSPSRSFSRLSLGLPQGSSARAPQPRFSRLSPTRSLSGLPTYEEAVAQGAWVVPAGTPSFHTPRRPNVAVRHREENPSARANVGETLFVQPEVLSTPVRDLPPGVSPPSSQFSTPRTPDSLPDLVPLSDSEEEIPDSPVARELQASRNRVRRLLQLEILHIQTTDRLSNNVWEELCTILIESGVCGDREQVRATFVFAFGRSPESHLNFICDDTLRHDVYESLVRMPEYRPE